MSPVTRAVGLEGQRARLDGAVDQPGEAGLRRRRCCRWTAPLSPWVRVPQWTSPVTLPSTWSWPGVGDVAGDAHLGADEGECRTLALAADGRLAAARKHALSSPLGGAAIIAHYGAGSSRPGAGRRGGAADGPANEWGLMSPPAPTCPRRAPRRVAGRHPWQPVAFFEASPVPSPWVPSRPRGPGRFPVGGDRAEARPIPFFFSPLFGFRPGQAPPGLHGPTLGRGRKRRPLGSPPERAPGVSGRNSVEAIPNGIPALQCVRSGSIGAATPECRWESPRRNFGRETPGARSGGDRAVFLAASAEGRPWRPGGACPGRNPNGIGRASARSPPTEPPRPSRPGRDPRGRDGARLETDPAAQGGGPRPGGAPVWDKWGLVATSAPIRLQGRPPLRRAGLRPADLIRPRNVR